jgi:hypothetical protein
VSSSPRPPADAPLTDAPTAEVPSAEVPPADAPEVGAVGQPPQPDRPPYVLTIDLNVLNHLGINLYSNVPAVVSEAVANAWDAGATAVDITIAAGGDHITIADDGVGMSAADVNERYLKVGYDKRKAGVTRSARFDRPVMGRKGIGKLSLFSIANEIEVQTVHTNGRGAEERSGFVMSAAAIRQQIGEPGKARDYAPTPLAPGQLTVERGTRITLRALKRSGAISEKYLRQRLARRFSVLGPAHNFVVRVNRTEIGVEDRDYFRNVQFVWTFGPESAEYRDACSNAERTETIPAVVSREHGYTVTGWLGTFDERKSIDDGNNTIVVLARGRLVQEDLLKDIDEGGIFTKYLIGEVRADFLDNDHDRDIATSDRQRVVEDDPRWRLVRKFVSDAVKTHVKLNWGKWRKELAEKRALEISAIAAWYESLGTDHKRYARELFGHIEALPVRDPGVKRELYKSSILAFESLAFRRNLAALEQVEDATELRRLVEVIGSLDELEAIRYVDTVRGRLEVIDKIESVKEDALEVVLQQYLFDHLWLLDASWERAATDAGMEVIVGKEWKHLDAKLDPEERRARLDIKYRTAAGKHIVVELKKYDRPIGVFELADQIQKYRDALTKVLTAKYPHEPLQLEFICVLGAAPREFKDNPERVRGVLRELGARFVTFDQLLRDARVAYGRFLDERQAVERIRKLVESI